MSFDIRRATPDDIPALTEYEIEISRISFGDEAITDPKHHRGRIEKSMGKDNGGMLVIEHGGTVGGWLWMDEKQNFATGEVYINFRSFYIAAHLRGGEAGETLLAEGLRWCKARGAKRVVGKVAAGNVPMRALYRASGFKATHIAMELAL